MIEINLAPGAKARRAPKSGGSAFQLPQIPALPDGGAVAIGAVGLLMLLVIGFAFWRVGARHNALEARVAQEVTDSTRFATTIALINTLQARQDTIRQQIDVIRQVDQRRYVWPHLLDEISKSVPQYTWLSDITTTEEGGARPAAAPGDTAAAAAPAVPVGPAFSVQGHAGSTQALTRLMKNLEGSPFIRDVTLVTSQQVDVEGRTIHRFTLEARYEMPDSTVIQTVPIIDAD